MPTSVEYCLVWKCGAKDDILSIIPPQSPHNEVTYTLTGDSTAMEYFMVDANTGHIGLKKSVVLDPERRTSYTLQISARDRGEPTSKAATNRYVSGPFGEMCR